MLNRKYEVYENDLKFDNSLKSNKDIVYDKPHLKDIGETNTFDYRLKLMDSNNNFLDLTNMNLSNLSFFIKYENIYDKIYYLFLNNNKLNSTIDLSYLKNFYEL